MHSRQGGGQAEQRREDVVEMDGGVQPRVWWQGPRRFRPTRALHGASVWCVANGALLSVPGKGLSLYVLGTCVLIIVLIDLLVGSTKLIGDI